MKILTKSVIISFSGLKNIVLNKHQEEDDYTFVFGDVKFQMKSIFAEFISQVVSHLHQTVPTINTIDFGNINGMKQDRVFNFYIVSELSGQEIEDRVFVHGSNEFGQLGLGEETKSISSFTEISSLVGYSFTFETRESKILSCGRNINSQLLLSSGPVENVYSPVETTITSGAAFCIAGNSISVVFMGGNPPPKTQNMQIDE